MSSEIFGAGADEEWERLSLADAQTSGGLLISVPEDRAAALGAALTARGIAGPVVGVVRGGEAGRIKVEGRPAA